MLARADYYQSWALLLETVTAWRGVARTESWLVIGRGAVSADASRLPKMDSLDELSREHLMQFLDTQTLRRVAFLSWGLYHR
jgi:hypothetical protein